MADASFHQPLRVLVSYTVKFVFISKHGVEKVDASKNFFIFIWIANRPLVLTPNFPGSATVAGLLLEFRADFIRISLGCPVDPL